MQKSILENIDTTNTISDSNQAIDRLFSSDRDANLCIVKIYYEKDVNNDYLLDIIHNYLPKSANCILLETTDHFGTYLVDTPENNAFDDYDIFYDLFAFINNKTGCNIAYSSLSDSPMKLGILYEEATFASKFLDEDVIVSYCNIKNRTSEYNVDNYPCTTFEQLSKHLNDLNFNGCKDALTQLIDIISADNSPEFFIRCILIDTLTLIINAMNRANVNFDIYSPIYYDALFLCRSGSYEVEKGKIIDSIQHLLNLYSEEIEHGTIQIESLKKFMSENCYSSYFSNTVLADAFNTSVPYISQVFKKKLGMNPSEYVWQLRLEKSIHLLINTDIPINEISKQVGYDIPSSFRRKFKATMGISPSTYRIDHSSPN